MYATLFLIVFFSAAGITAVATVVYLASLPVLFGRLRRSRPDMFARLGEPSLIMNNNPYIALKVVRFLLGADYRKLGDAGIERVGNVSRLTLIIGLVGTGLMFLMMALSMVRFPV